MSMRINRLVLPDKTYITGDDVMCACMAKQLNPDVKIDFTNKVTPEMMNDPGTVIANIGGGKYDKRRENRERCLDRHISSSRLLFNDIKGDLFPNGVPDRFEFDLRMIDLTEKRHVSFNNKTPFMKICDYSDPTWDSQDSVHSRFLETTDFLKGHYMEPMIASGFVSELHSRALADRLKELQSEYTKSMDHAKDVINDAFNRSDGKIVLIDINRSDAYFPWKDVLKPTTAELVVLHSPDSGYVLDLVPSSNMYKSGVSYPEKWQNEPPEGSAPIPDSTRLTFDTQEHAMAAGQEAIALHGKETRSKRDLPPIWMDDFMDEGYGPNGYAGGANPECDF